jgi:hypothetical protein
MSQQRYARNLLDFFNKLSDFSISIIYKDQVVADSLDTSAALKSSNTYISEKIKDDGKPNSYLLSYEENTRTIYNNLAKILPVTESLLQTGEGNKYFRNLYVEEDIDMMVARFAEDFTILKYSTTILTKNEANIYLEEYEKSLLYYKKVLYTPGLGNGASYRNFSRFFVTFMTIQAVLDRFFDDNTSIELVDEWTLNNILYSHGVYFLDELGLAFKRNVVKKLNELISNKGSDKSFETIFEIFGFKNIYTFRYYLLKADKLEDGFPTGEVELRAMPVPSNVHDVEEYIVTMPAGERDRLTKSYRSLVAGDDTWLATEEEVMQAEFDIVQTKYVDANAAFDVVEWTTKFVYFYHLVLRAFRDKNTPVDLEFNAPLLSSQPVTLLEGITAMLTLTLRYMGYEGVIPIDKDDIRTVYRYANRKSQGHTYSSSFLDRFAPTAYRDPDAVKNWDQVSFEDSFLANEALRTNLGNAIKTESDKDKYDELVTDYNALFTAAINKDAYHEFEDYDSFLKDQNPSLFEFVELAHNISDTSSRESSISRAITDIHGAMSTYLNEVEVNVGTITVNYILKYASQLINVFKAYTVQLRDMKIYYTIDTPFHRMGLLDKMVLEELHMTMADLSPPLRDELTQILNRQFGELITLGDSVSILDYRSVLHEVISTLKDSVRLKIGAKAAGNYTFQDNASGRALLKFFDELFEFRDEVSRKLNNRISEESNNSLYFSDNVIMVIK